MKYQLLKQYFGYDSFRPGQEILIDSILKGRDVLGIMPTGAGKSICYQIPALIMDGITLVISPLISLMKDQVESLNQAGIHAAYLNSSLTVNQYYKALSLARNGRYPIIYVAPERLLSPEFLDFACHVKISMVAVDEAHCVSQWGAGFPAQLFENHRICGAASETSGGQCIYRYGDCPGPGRYQEDFEAAGPGDSDHGI